MSSPSAFLSGNKQMENLIQSHDWNGSQLGTPDKWPALLKSSFSLIAQSKQPMSICWGKDLIHLYNEAFATALNSQQHVFVWGQSIKDSAEHHWDHAKHQMMDMLEDKAQDRATAIPGCDLDIQGERWWRCTLSPIAPFDDVRPIAGVLIVWTDVTLERHCQSELMRFDQRLSAELSRMHQLETQQTFKMKLADALRQPKSAAERASIALQMSGTFTGADHAYYVQLSASDTVCDVFQQWHRSGNASDPASTAALSDFGPIVVAQLREKLSVAIDDACCDARTATFNFPHFGFKGRAFLVTPLFKNDTLISFFMLTQDDVRTWSDNDIGMIEEIADRICNAIEYALEHARRLEAEHVLSVERTSDHLRLQSLFKHAPGFMCILRGPHHVFEFVNDSYLHMIGQRDLIGLEAREAMRDVVEQDSLNLLDRVYASGQPYTGVDMAVTLSRASGEHKKTSYLDFVLQPILDSSGATSGIFVEGFDVTERTLAKKALEVSQQRLKEGMSAAKMVIWDWDLVSNEVVFLGSDNHFFDHGSAVDDIWDHINSDDIERLHAARNHAMEGSDTYSEVVRVHRDGVSHPIWMQIHGHIDRDAHGKPFLVRGVSIDVTALKQAEQALLNESKRKDEFLAMLSHELRNPLAPIVAAAEIMGRPNVPETSLQRASIIVRRQADHMTALVNDMLDVSRVTTGNVVLSKQVVRINDVLRDSIEQVRPLLDAQGLTLVFDAPDDSGMIDGDRERLIQIFTNLLQNSAKFTPAGGHLWIAQRDLESRIAVSVRDDGIGIEPELLHHVFELFVQGKGTIDRLHGGLGLGLSLVKSLVELHGGTISAYSEGVGKGAEFTAIFPQSTASPVDIHYPKVTAVQPNEKSRRILLVDDNEDAAVLLALLLEDDGYSVVTTVDPLQALEIAKANPPDLFILDIGLPGIDGNELARRLRSMPSTAHIPMIALTGYGQATDLELAKSSGFDLFFVKPTGIDKLLEAISKMYGNPACR